MDNCFTGRMQACIDEFPAMVTEGVVHGVYKVVSPSSFHVTERNEWR